MRSDSDIRHEVEAALGLDPNIDTIEIGVTVHSGVVMLAGFVRDDLQRQRIESEVSRIQGVAGIANDLEVRPCPLIRQPDPAIAGDAAAAIKFELTDSLGDVKAVVKNGTITLEGAVEWDHQRERIEAAMHRIPGVRKVVSRIVLRPEFPDVEFARAIEEEFRRNLEIDALGITLEVNGRVVIQRGAVHFHAERQQAERVAWAIRGVSQVHNQITVSP
jgi:osmotically-inducible protein OsmY